MRRAVFAVLSVAIAASTAACVPSDIQDPNQRAAAGAFAGAALGSAIGATFAINPGAGALFGAGIGGISGAVIGEATAEPEPSYDAIEAPTTPVVPAFYDTWAPGYHAPKLGTQTPPPPVRPG